MRKTRRKLGLAVALLLAAVLTGGGFASTASTNSISFPVTAATGDIATVAVAGGQPNWGSIVPPPAAEVLRPNGAGDETGIASQFPNTGAHWDKVAETSSDGDDTYVGTSNSAWQEDLYNIANHSTGSGVISYVRVYAMVRASATPSQTSAYIHIKTNGTEYNGPATTVIGTYSAYYYQWNTNPATANAWTWTDIDSLQIGLGLRRPAAGQDTRATQVYAEVGYRYVPISGTVPTGNLFTVTPRTGYPGDLAVKVYLVNTNSLIKAYHALNIRLYLAGSAEAGQTPNYQVLTLDNGTVTLNLANGAGISRTLSVIGGTYQLVSSLPDQWQAGWTVTPELAREVTQR